MGAWMTWMSMRETGKQENCNGVNACYRRNSVVDGVVDL